MDEVSQAPRDIGRNGRYHVVRALGKRGRVTLAYDRKDETLVAIRFIKRESKTNLSYIEREILRRRALYHHHVIRFQEVFLRSDALCIVMGYAPGGTLLNFVNQHRYLNEDWARRFFQQLIIAVAYNQHRGVTMEDIRMENILLNGNQEMIWLCDLNLKGAYDSDAAVSVNDPYSPPEIELGQSSKHVDTKKADVFSCGVCLYYMIFGRFPLIGKNGALRIPDDQKRADTKPNVSPECTKFVSWVLSANPQRRPTVDEIIRCGWFQKYLPEGAEDYNQRLKDVNDDVVEAALGLQSEAVVKSIIGAASKRSSLANPNNATESFKNEGNEDRWLYRWIQRSVESSLKKCMLVSQLASKKKNDCFSAVQLVRSSISRNQRVVHCASS